MRSRRIVVSLLVIVSCLALPSVAHAVTRCEALARAQKWVDAAVPYSWDAWYTDPTTGVCCYRSDCSGLVSAVWGLPPPGHTTYSFAGGPWDDGSTYVISPADLQPGDALNYPGSPSSGTGHIMLYVSGDFNSGWVEVYEEYGHGHPAVHRWRSINPSQYLAIRFTGIQPCEDCNTSCGNFGCACVDGQCNGGYCPGTGCTAQETQNCGAYGCSCVDHQCNGGYCPGTGCTAKEANDCAAFGCGCVDHQCSGGFGCTANGNGCTIKENNDCAQYGCNCSDHKCSGGFCAPTECGDQQVNDCAAFGCGCAKGQCSGGACPSCTAEATQNCAAFGCGCAANECTGGACGGSAGGESGGGGESAGSAGSAGANPSTGGAPNAGGSWAGGSASSTGSDPEEPGLRGGTTPEDEGCTLSAKPRSERVMSALLLALLVVGVARRRATGSRTSQGARSRTHGARTSS
jgi:hypothetical protein